MDNLRHEISKFKFSKLTRDDLSEGTAKFILLNMGKLSQKESHILLGLIEQLCLGYLDKLGVDSPKSDWSLPVSQRTGNGFLTG